MCWIKGSGNINNPIVIDSYGGDQKPIINGDGYQACILIYNDDNININNLELFNEASHLDSLGNTKKINGFGGLSNLWGSGKDRRFGIKKLLPTKTHYSILNYMVYRFMIFFLLQRTQTTPTRATG